MFRTSAIQFVVEAFVHVMPSDFRLIEFYAQFPSLQSCVCWRTKWDFGSVGISVFCIFADLHFQLQTFVIWGNACLGMGFSKLVEPKRNVIGIGSPPVLKIGSKASRPLGAASFTTDDEAAMISVYRIVKETS
jgi:hypothetical protein